MDHFPSGAPTACLSFLGVAPPMGQTYASATIPIGSKTNRYIPLRLRKLTACGVLVAALGCSGGPTAPTETGEPGQIPGVGTGPFAPRDPFSSCPVSIEPDSRTITSEAATGTVAMSIPAGCEWTAESGASFITITGGASGIGSGTVSYSVAANVFGTPRTGTLTIAGVPFMLTQDGVPCDASIAPEGTDLTGAGGTGTVTVTIPAGCAWQASAGSSGWVSITSGASGVGPGTVTYSVLPNTTGGSRNHSMSIAGHSFMVSQSTAGAPNCTATLSPSSATVAQAATTGSVTVTLPSSACAWTAASNASWITVTSGSSGTGSGTVSYSVSELTSSNSSYPSRSGTVTIAQQTFTLTQTAPSCGSSSVTLSPTSASFTGAGGTGTVSVTIPAGCAWDVLPNITTNWITIQSPGVRTGPSTVTYTVAPNTSGASRNHSLGFAGQSFMVSQAAN